MQNYKIERHINNWLKVSYRVVNLKTGDWITSFKTKKDAALYISQLEG